jgi:hypothetical protein
MKRVVVVYNPRSSQATRVEDEVISRLPDAEKYEVEDTDVDKNAAKLAKILRDDDLVITAGGDATATIGLNGAMLSGKDVSFAPLPYGNFNDAARGLQLRNLGDALAGRARKAWVLECLLDGEHYRYGLCYFTVGMFAEATEIFDHPKYRKKLREKPSLVFSIRILAEWWMKNRGKKFLPEKFMLNRREVSGVSDYVALNSSSMAKAMRGRKWFYQREFRSKVGGLTSFAGLLKIMAPSVAYKMPGKMSRDDKLKFAKPSEVMIQGEGEYKRVKVAKIEMRKAERWIKVVSRN